jgi:hypothetical protein
MTKNIVIAMAKDFKSAFIGDLDEEKGVLKEVYRIFSQYIEGGKRIQFGMVDPFLPYSEDNNKPISEMPKDLFLPVFREPREEIKRNYLQALSDIIIPNRPDGKGGKIVTAQAAEVVRFSDIKKKPR